MSNGCLCCNASMAEHAGFVKSFVGRQWPFTVDHLQLINAHPVATLILVQFTDRVVDPQE